MRTTQYVIHELDAGWSIEADGEHVDDAPTAVEALALVKAREHELVGDGARVAQVEWLPTTRVGQLVAQVVAR